MRRMTTIALAFALLCLGAEGFAQPKTGSDYPDLSYFLPDQGKHSYDENIPTPADVLGFPTGSRHVEWSHVTTYFARLAELSDRVSVRQTDVTYQGRPIIEAVISSPANLRDIETIRAGRLRDDKRLPVTVSLMYGMHGNEPSGVNASLAVAYFLAAARGAETDAMLENTVVVIVPGMNPDGINRFATWVNSSRSFTDVSDPNSREFAEPWPSSRTNHYWADCNRDWLPAQHPEGRACLRTYHDWLPHLAVDFHEQGPSRHYYFSPGHPKRTHPLTSQLNQTVTAEVSAFCAGELDKIGTLYYSKEGYDDFYYGKGAAYGDIRGSVCLLYEQPTTRGHLRETRHGVRSFAWTVRNQARTSYATLAAAYALRDRLKDYRAEFRRRLASDAARHPVKGYVFNARGGRAVTWHFLDNLNRHGIEVYGLARDVVADGVTYRASDSYLIPLEQDAHLTIRAIMENMTDYSDSIFYDVSTWTFPHAFNLNCSELKAVGGLKGERVENPRFEPGTITGGGSDTYAYVFECTEYYSLKVMYELLAKGVRVSVTDRPFTFKNRTTERRMGYGTAMVAVGGQPLSPTELHSLLSRLAAETGTEILVAETGLMSEVDLGSPSFNTLRLPEVAVMAGRGTGIPDAGEVWYLLDRRFGIPVTMLETPTLNARKLRRYNVIVLPDGVPELEKSSVAALKEWVAGGGTLIACGKAWTWVDKNDLLKIRAENTAFREDSTAFRPYAERETASAGNSISGVIMKCTLDVSHPLGWGFDRREIAVMKDNNIIFRKDADPYASPLRYAASPRLSGFLASKHVKKLANKPAVIAKSVGDGAVIVFADDMNFRSYWFGTSRIFLNAVFFGECLKKTNYYY